MVHRTLVRQKNTFTILGGMLVDNSNAIVKVSTAPNFWYTKAAINRGFRAWKQMRSRTLQNADLEDNKLAVGKYSDFKVTLNGSTASLNPIYTGGSTLAQLPGPGEWNHADLRDEDGNVMKFRIVGATSSPWYGLLHGWLRTRATPDATNEPTMPDLDNDNTPDYKVDFLANMFDTTDGQPERLELVYEENDTAPFSINTLYGNTDSIDNLQLQSMVYLAGAPSANDPAVHGAKTEAMIPGFKALCGLIRVDVEQGSDPVLFLDVMNTPEGF